MIALVLCLLAVREALAARGDSYAAVFPSNSKESFAIFYGDWRDNAGETKLDKLLRGDAGDFSDQPRKMRVDKPISGKGDTETTFLKRRGLLQKPDATAVDLVWVRVGLPAVPLHDYPLIRYAQLKPHQTVNRFPLISTELNQKDTFALHFQRMQQKFGHGEFGFHPVTYVLPLHADALASDAAASEDEYPLIVKPVFGGRGVGIMMASSKNLSSIPMTGEYLVQRYIPNPLLIDGHKFTLRLYVLITSVDPLRVYFYREGIAKFATQKFEAVGPGGAGSIHMHITNNALNTGTASYYTSTDPEVDDVGSRRSLRGFRSFCEQFDIDHVVLFHQIKDVLTKSLIAVSGALEAGYRKHNTGGARCFQLLGVDVDVDSDLKPWLIEANVNPSLDAKAPFEVAHKNAMLDETLDLGGVIPTLAAQPLRTAARSELLSELGLEASVECGESAELLSCLTNDDVNVLTDLLVEVASPRLGCVDHKGRRAVSLSQAALADGFERLYPNATSASAYAHFFETASRTRETSAAFVQSAAYDAIVSRLRALPERSQDKDEV